MKHDAYKFSKIPVKCIWCEKVFPEKEIVETDENGEDVCPRCGRHGWLAWAHANEAAWTEE